MKKMICFILLSVSATAWAIGFDTSRGPIDSTQLPKRHFEQRCYKVVARHHTHTTPWWHCKGNNNRAYSCPPDMMPVTFNVWKYTSGWGPWHKTDYRCYLTCDTFKSIPTKDCDK